MSCRLRKGTRVFSSIGIFSFIYPDETYSVEFEEILINDGLRAEFKMPVETVEKYFLSRDY